MPILGITGGIATGKSTFARALLSAIPGRLFDSDICARDLLDNDRLVQQAVLKQFGPEILAADGMFNRSRLREIVFAHQECREKLEKILHPAIRKTWLTLARVTGDKEWLFVDIPLLYETGAERYFDAITVVACSDQTQRWRLTENRKLTPSMTQQIIDAQLPLRQKVERADFLIWNEGSTVALSRQAAHFAQYLIKRYG